MVDYSTYRSIMRTSPSIQSLTCHRHIIYYNLQSLRKVFSINRPQGYNYDITDIMYLLILHNKSQIEQEKRILAESCFDQPTSGLWAPRASSAPFRCDYYDEENHYVYKYILYIIIINYYFQYNISIKIICCLINLLAKQLFYFDFNIIMVNY